VADRLAGYEAGGDDYVTKPYEEGELFAKVKTLLRLKREEEMNHLKSNFLSLISHGTRTPINGILGCAELLLECTSGKAQQLAGGVLQSAKHLHRLLENVLLMSKLKSSPVSIQTDEKIQIGILIQNQLKELEESIFPQKLSISLAGNLLTSVNSCQSLLGKGFYCILENAVKFSNSKGQVIIDIEERDRQCVVRIADQGPGIQPDIIDHIFDEFAVQDIPHHHHGLGISLSIAKQIFHKHGGEIRAENGPQEGAVFTVILPIG